MEYYITIEGRTVGPMTKEQIFAYKVTEKTPVSVDGGEWAPLFTFPELQQLLQPARTRTGTPDYLPCPPAPPRPRTPRPQLRAHRQGQNRGRSSGHSDRHSRNTLFLYRQDRSRHIHHPAVTGDMRSMGHHHSYPGHYDADHEPRGI